MANGTTVCRFQKTRYGRINTSELYFNVGGLVVFPTYFHTNSAKAYSSKEGDTRFRTYPPGTVITFTQPGNQK